MKITSGALPCPRAILGLLFFLCVPASWVRGQITTGTVEGSVTDVQRKPPTDAKVLVRRLPNGPEFTAAADARGRFTLVLPYGNYELSVSGEFTGASPIEKLHVSASQTVQCPLVILEKAGISSSGVKAPVSGAPPASAWSLDLRRPAAYFGSYSIAGSLLNYQPTTVTQPLDFTGLASGRLALISQRALSWTGTRYELQGMDATDSYQPGYPVLLEDVQAVDEVVGRSGLSLRAERTYSSKIGTFLTQDATRDAGGVSDTSSRSRLPPSWLANWHGRLVSAGTGAPFASNNLPSAATRNVLRQSEHYNWYTRDNAQAGGPIGKRADVFFSGIGQWASQTIPVAPRGQDQNSRLLFGNASGRVQLTKKDRIDALYSGSRINLSDWGQPAGLEALPARRMAPSYDSLYGFGGVPELDHLNFSQVGWTRRVGNASGAGALQVRYGFSTARLDTFQTRMGQQSVTDLLTGVVTGPAPLTNRGVRTRQEIETAFLPGDYEWGQRHRIAIGGGWERSNARNRFAIPDNLNLLTAAGVPDTVVEFSGPVDSRDRIQEFSVYARDEIRLAAWLSVDVGVLGDFERGSVPGRGIPDRVEFGFAACGFHAGATGAAVAGFSGELQQAVRAVSR